MMLGPIKEATVEALYRLVNAARVRAGAENYLAHGVHLMRWVLHKELLETAPESEAGLAMHTRLGTYVGRSPAEGCRHVP